LKRKEQRESLLTVDPLLKGQTLYSTELQAHRATIVASRTYSCLFNCPIFNSRPIRSRWGAFGRNLKAQRDPPGLILAEFHVLSGCRSCSQSVRHHLTARI